MSASPPATNPPPLPLLGPRRAGTPLAWVDGRPVGADQFVAHARALAARLPQGGAAVNLCHDRYRFAVGFAAALLRGHTSLMPPNAMPETLARLAFDDARPYALVDDEAVDAAGLPRVAVDLADQAPSAPMPAVAARQAAVCLLTSGSTGAPQPHRKHWGPLVANIAAEAARLAELTGQATLDGLTLVATVPPQHSYGFESSVLLALLGGASFANGRPFYPADIAAALEQVDAPRALVTTPFHLKTLLRVGIALPPVALVLSATAPLSPQLAAEAEQRLGARLVEIYGCTEAGQVASRRPTDSEVWHTLGALRVWREDGGVAGERFVVQGGHVEQPTALADILELVDERHFRLLGRSGDLIHVAGKRSSLAHLNFHLNRVPGVVDGAFWMPDDVADGVARPVALVVAPGLQARDVIAGLRERIEPAFVPRRVVMLDALPREATGKITAAALRALAEPASAADAPAAGGRIAIDASHPAFDGHFPGQPVLPGVVLLDLVMQQLELRPALRDPLGAAPVIEQVKFVAPVIPPAQLAVALAARAGGIDFTVDDGARCVARGRLVPAQDRE